MDSTIARLVDIIDVPQYLLWQLYRNLLKKILTVIALDYRMHSAHGWVCVVVSFFLLLFIFFITATF